MAQASNLLSKIVIFRRLLHKCSKFLQNMDNAKNLVGFSIDRCKDCVCDCVEFCSDFSKIYTKYEVDPSKKHIQNSLSLDQNCGSLLLADII